MKQSCSKTIAKHDTIKHDTSCSPLRRVVSVLATCLSLRRVVSVFLLLHSEDGKQFAAVSLPGVIFLLQLSVHMELVEA